MSTRDEDREWLLRAARKYPDGWEAGIVHDFGVEGALDILAIQGGRVWEVDLRHTPFVRDRELKFLVSEAREALNQLSLRADTVWWEAAQARNSGND